MSSRTTEDIRRERRELKLRYGQLFDDVAALLFRHDPKAINFGSNTDEYEPEVGTILPRLKDCHSESDTCRIIHEEFKLWFGANECGEENDFAQIAKEVWLLWQKFDAPEFELVSLSSADELAQAAASAWLAVIEWANRAGKSHCVALSGGRIAKTFYSAVVKQAQAQSVSLQSVHFFWADERCVPPDDAESNFLLAHELLFTPLKVSADQIHRVRGEDSPEVAAKQAAEEICRIAPLNMNGQPILDLILLGIGEDGHVASLFPSEPEEMISDPAVYRAIKNSPKPPPNRVTLGYQAIAAAKQVWILASGGGKERVFADSLKPTGKTPFARVLKLRLSNKIFTDIPTLNS